MRDFMSVIGKAWKTPLFHAEVVDIKKAGATKMVGSALIGRNPRNYKDPFIAFIRRAYL